MSVSNQYWCKTGFDIVATDIQLPWDMTYGYHLIETFVDRLFMSDSNRILTSNFYCTFLLRLVEYRIRSTQLVDVTVFQERSQQKLYWRANHGSPSARTYFSLLIGVSLFDYITCLHRAQFPLVVRRNMGDCRKHSVLFV